MRRRYCSTNPWQVSEPARIAACTSAIVVSSTRNEGAAAGPCAFNERQRSSRTTDGRKVRIALRLAKKRKRRFVHARVRRARWSGIIRRIECRDHGGAVRWIEKEERAEARLTSGVPENRRRPSVNHEERE